MQLEIDAALEKDLQKAKKRKSLIPNEDYDENLETADFIGESTISVIKEVLSVENDGTANVAGTSGCSKNDMAAKAIITPIEGIKPDLVAMCAIADENPVKREEIAVSQLAEAPSFELDIEGLDDDEIDGYILTEKDAQFKVI